MIMQNLSIKKQQKMYFIQSIQNSTQTTFPSILPYSQIQFRFTSTR